MTTVKRDDSQKTPESATRLQSGKKSALAAKTTHDTEAKKYTKAQKRRKKQSPPIRLHDQFYKRVSAAAKLNSRSIPKQLEHLAVIAENIVGQITREELLDVQAGLRKISVVKVETPCVDKSMLFKSLNDMRNSGELTKSVTKARIKYQSSLSHPGCLERINNDGSRDIGTFKGGKFKLVNDLP